VPFRLPESQILGNQWQKSLFLTIAVHISLLLLSVFGPRFLHFQKKIPEVYTVNLFSVDDLGGAPAAAPAPTAEESAAPEAPTPSVTPPPPPVKTAPTPKAKPEPLPPPAAKDTVSLKPIKSKDKSDLDKLKKLRETLANEDKVKQAKAAELKAEMARAEAERKAKSAVSSLKQALMAGQQAATAGKAASGHGSGNGQAKTGAGAGAGSGGGGGIMVDENLRRYLIAVNQQIQEHWILPDTQNWKANTEAIVIIRVRRDGTIVENSFKKKSDNLFFNQFVEKTLKLSSPLPPFPIGLNQPEMEIGLKFRPGEVF